MALRLQVRNEWCRRVQAARLPRRKAAPAPGLQVRGPITAAYRHPRHGGGALHRSTTPGDTEKKQSWASSLSPRWIPERALSAARSMMGEMPNSGLPGAEGPPAEAAAKMIVFGVSFSTTKDAFREYWAQYGELAECELMFARDGRWG